MGTSIKTNIIKYYQQTGRVKNKCHIPNPVQAFSEENGVFKMVLSKVLTLIYIVFKRMLSSECVGFLFF